MCPPGSLPDRIVKDWGFVRSYVIEDSHLFYQTQPPMALVERVGRARPAFGVPPASGTKYEGQDVMFWEARGEASVLWSGTELKCQRR
jgi:hypothetical protein